MLITTQQNHAFRFRRFSHKAYAAFCSLHREVTIGCVATHIADLQLEKSNNNNHNSSTQTNLQLEKTTQDDNQEEIELLCNTNDVVVTLIATKQSAGAVASCHDMTLQFLKLSICIIGSFFIMYKLSQTTFV